MRNLYCSQLVPDIDFLPMDRMLLELEIVSVDQNVLSEPSNSDYIDPLLVDPISAVVSAMNRAFFCPTFPRWGECLGTSVDTICRI